MNAKRVLLVEDNITVAALYRGLLERAGAKVHVVSDGSDAFMEAHHQVYDVLLLDVMLPSMDGIAILGRLRAQKRFARIPIFVYSSGDLAQIEPLALEAGATRVFSKSIPAKDVVTAIADHLATCRPAAEQATEPAGDTEHWIKGDFRVQGSEPPKPPQLQLRMKVEQPPPPPPPPPPKPAPITLKEEPEAPKKGLLSRWFTKRSKYEDENEAG